MRFAVHHLKFMFLLSGVLGCLPARGHTAGLDCPEMGPGAVPRRMRQFDTILQQQLAANMMPLGSLVIANVPLPPAVYRTLRAQAAASGQAPAQLMAAILSRAAGN